jgi:uncharacterized protein YecE (DUF72 family)
MQQRRFFLGCAVWAYKDWVGDLFPPGSKSADFLRLYSRRLTAVEGNTSFYALPKPASVERWVAETPADFRFCFKLPREISHSGNLVHQLPATQDFLERLAPLGARLGPAFLQLPPIYGPERLPDLQRWLAHWPTTQALTVEVRHPGWFEPLAEERLIETLERYRVGRVIMDVRPIRSGSAGTDPTLATARERKPDVPMHALVSGKLVLLRYIGHPNPEHNDELLDEWAERIADWLGQGITVYAFMHCPDEARSPGLCRALQQRLNAYEIAPPLPWEALAQPSATQMNLFDL